MTHFQLQKY